MLWTLPLLPILAGAGVWAAGPAVRARRGDRDAPEGDRDAPDGDGPRLLLGAAATVALAATLALALWAAWARPAASAPFGAGLRLYLEVDGIAAVVAVVVPAIALPIVVYAAGHEPARGLARLLGLLVAFVGAMELLVVAADLLTLLIGWELVGALSWGLIGHEWWEADKPRAAAHAFNATRFGDLGLFLAAMAAFAAVGSLAYADLAAIDGASLHVMVAGIVLAAAAKSAQVPFAPWLFSAMGGPTPVSALLHAATMVAAGAFLLARLEPVLAAASWFGPTVIAIGLVTALAGGVVAALQQDAKKLLAGSTSAQYGLVFVAVGAGYPAIAVAHLAAHAAFKALLFLTAGVAISAVGSQAMHRMRLGSHLRITAALAAVGSLALAAVPPLGGAWTKEKVTAAAGHEAAWLAILVIVAGGLSALYAARFQLLAFGRHRGDAPSPRSLPHHPGAAEHAALWTLAGASVLLGLLWLPQAQEAVTTATGGEVPAGKLWELVASLAVIAVAGYGAWSADVRGRLGSVGARGVEAAAADWLALPLAVERAIVAPTLAGVAALARFDDRVVDGVARGLGRGAAGLAGAASSALERGVDGTVTAVGGWFASLGRDARRLQTGFAHHYLTIVTVGVVLLFAAAALWR